MAASYPTAVKTFTAKSNGDTIDVSFVTDLEAEVTAIESGILNGTAPVTCSNVTAHTLDVTKPPPQALVFSTGVQVTNSTTIVSFLSETFVSTSTMHSTSANPTRVIAPSSGTYLVSADLKWNGFSTGGFRIMRLIQTGNFLSEDARVGPASVVGQGHHIVAMTHLDANDYLELEVQQTGASTGSISIVHLNLAKIR